MATINKISVRDEVDRLKQQFSDLKETSQISPEIRVLFESLLVIVEVILSVFMEKTTSKNNKNSSLPSSQTEKDGSSLFRVGNRSC